MRAKATCDAIACDGMSMRKDIWINVPLGGGASVGSALALLLAAAVLPPDCVALCVIEPVAVTEAGAGDTDGVAVREGVGYTRRLLPELEAVSDAGAALSDALAVTDSGDVPDALGCMGDADAEPDEEVDSDAVDVDEIVAAGVPESDDVYEALELCDARRMGTPKSCRWRCYWRCCWRWRCQMRRRAMGWMMSPPTPLTASRRQQA